MYGNLVITKQEDMMVCEVCGTQLDNDIRYCKNCKDYCNGMTENEYEGELRKTNILIQEWDKA